MTETLHRPVLIVDAGTGAGSDVGLALTGLGYPATVAADGTIDDQQAQITEFAAGLADDDGGNVIYLSGQGTPSQEQLQALALRLAPKVRINAVGPGSAATAGQSAGAAQIEQWPSLPLGPMVATAEIVSAIQFILDTPSITGQVIALDGRANDQANETGDTKL